ncbi:hypothetical protein C8F04DRAFT_1261121 [Mycena alexandri]|uniref:Uncharacterized protein n=1 Tax=Mycena alexandri TaxID=1745969 RepID=A0AAD6SV85_9AGAR|nr:hypothetical protein C8F04DRAFT_1261121 [Mycena alexandri]
MDVKVALKRQPEADILRQHIRQLKDRLRCRTAQLDAVRNDFVALAGIHKHQLIQLNHSLDFLQDTESKIQKVQADPVEFQKCLDALNAEEATADVEERELGFQYERLLAATYPDDDETLFSVDNRHLEKQISTARRRQDVLRNCYGALLQALGGVHGQDLPPSSKSRNGTDYCVDSDCGFAATQVAESLLDGQTKLFELRETEIKKLKSQGDEVTRQIKSHIEETVNSRMSSQLDQLREVSHNKITLEMARSSQLKAELQMQSAELVAARTHLEHLEAQALANQSDLIGQQAAFRRILATSCEGFNQSPLEMERVQILKALGLAVGGFSSPSFRT